ncbi:MAG: circularly permuted type 2 ATP-grasp protein [Saprospiraceae bacterium]|nr:circularly permuted type 2 ATP-grasp protein [Saprospiraceae bacterium]
MLSTYVETNRGDEDVFFDELYDRGGNILPHWQRIMQTYEYFGPGDLVRKHRAVQRQLRENGVTYNVYGDPEGSNRPWDLDPVPMVFAHEDWQHVEAGLKQRVHLLNQILIDIYGSRTLLRSNKLPLEMIYNHQGFLRQADKIMLPGKNQLIQYAADLARGPNGKMWVLNDRVDAPSGMGYALENRAAMTRVFPSMLRENRVRKISSYYQTLKDTLTSLSPRDRENPRIVILSPGARNETYFEHAYLSSVLGITMAFGRDLTVRDGYVWLRTLKGLEKVDVILRRVDDVFCDPLEFDDRSQLGVVGLMEAVRSQKVRVVNPIGCRILENPGFMAFLPSLCEEILGEELLLPSVATWWCGQEAEKKYVLDNLKHLIIKTIYRDHRNRSIYGGELTSPERERLKKRISLHPYLYVGQETVNFSTTPSLIEGKLMAKKALFRSYVTADSDSGQYAIMPGGLARSSTSDDFFKVSNQSGGISKDAWVLSAPTSEVLEHEDVPTRMVIQPIENVLPSRAGENLYWLGRYAERAMYTVRLLRQVLGKYNESDPANEDEQAMLRMLFRATTELTATYPGFVGTLKDVDEVESRLANPEKELISIIGDATRVGSLSHSLRMMLNNSYAVRDRLSLDTWRILDGINEDIDDLSEQVQLNGIHSLLDQMIVKLMAFNGLNIDNMTREDSWHLLNFGRYLEAIICSSRLMRATLVADVNIEMEKMLMEVVLLCNDNLLTYRYRYRSNLQMEGVLMLLMAVRQSPRSLIYYLSELEEIARALPYRSVDGLLSPLEKKIVELKMLVQLAEPKKICLPDIDSGERDLLSELLGKITDSLAEVSNMIIENYFSHTQNTYHAVRTGILPQV